MQFFLEFLQSSAMAISVAFLIAFLFNSGNEPGIPMQIGHTFVLGSNSL